MFRNLPPITKNLLLINVICYLADVVFQRYGIDDQLWTEGLNFFKRCEALGVIGKAQAVRVDVVNRSFVVETQEVNEEGTHFSGAEDKDFHI